MSAEVPAEDTLTGLVDRATCWSARAKARQLGAGGRGSPAPGQVLGGPLREVGGPGQAPGSGGEPRGAERAGRGAGPPPPSPAATAQPKPGLSRSQHHRRGHGAPRRLGQDARGPAAAGAGAPAGGAARYTRAENGARRGDGPWRPQGERGKGLSPTPGSRTWRPQKGEI